MSRHLVSQFAMDTQERTTHVTQAWNACDRGVRRFLAPFTDFTLICVGVQPYTKSEAYGFANRACGAFRDEILQLCPASFNRTLAEQYICLARMKISELIDSSGSQPANWPGEVTQSIFLDLLSARCFAIASLTPLLPEETSSWKWRE